MALSEKTKNFFYIAVSNTIIVLMTISNMPWWWIVSGVAAVVLVMMMEVNTNGPFMITQEKIMMGTGLIGMGIMVLIPVILAISYMGVETAWENRKIWLNWIEKQIKARTLMTLKEEIKS